MQRIPLMTEAGEIVGDAIMSMNACYQDKDGQPRTILMPLVTYLAMGRLVAWSRSDLGAYSESDAMGKVADMAEYIYSHGWVKGAVIAGGFALDMGKYYSNSRHRYDDWYRPTVEALQTGREDQIERFLAREGEFKLPFIVPVDVIVDIAFKVPGLR